MIGKGSKVKILSRENKIGIVLEVKADFVQVNYQNKTEWFPISDLVETTNELLSRLIKNDIEIGVHYFPNHRLSFYKKPRIALFWQALYT